MRKSSRGNLRMHFDLFHTAGRRACFAFALLVAAAVGSGCSSSTKPVVVGPPLSRVTVTPAADTLLAGTQRLFVATAYDTSNAVVDVGIAWGSTNTAVCTVNGNGLVTALAEGVASIVAASGGKADTATVYVTGALAGWNTQTSGTTQALNDVHFLSDGRTGFAVGNAGVLTRPTDAGVTWTASTIGGGTALQSVCFTSPLVGWAVGAGGAVLKTTNAGAAWTRLSSFGSLNDLNCVRFADEKHGWIVGANGQVSRTVDGGATWIHRNLFSQALHSVAFSDTLNGWIVGATGTVMGTHDGGVSWYDVPLSISAQTLNAVASPTGTVACAVSAQGTVARSHATVDSLAWTTASIGAGNQLNGISMVSATTGWVVGSNAGGLVLVTTNGGATWTAQASGSAQALNAVYFTDPLRGWAVGAAGRIIHTTHGGN
jgi:photosystem II stability/assembly factor-like uncharacterized protein